MADQSKVFVVHGRNLELRDALFRFLRSLGLKPIEWSQAVKETGKASPYIGEVLDAAFSIAQAIVVLMTPDDEARLHTDFRSPHDPAYEINLTGQARPNVLFEAGMAIGRSPNRTVIIEIGVLRPFSDIGGRHVIRLNNSAEVRKELAERLTTAGCAVDLTGCDWLKEGEFTLLATPLTTSITETQGITITSNRAKIGVCEISYPVIKGMGNPAIQAKINSFLHDKFVIEEENYYRDPENDEDRNSLLHHTNERLIEQGLDEGSAFTTLDSVDYQVTLMNQDCLSLRHESYYGGGAHPGLVSKAYTIDLNTGHLYSFSELFDPETEYLLFIQNLLEESSEYGGGRKRSVYDFCLKENAIVIFNLFDNHAMHSVEAELSFDTLSRVLPSQGLIRQLINGKI